MDVKVYITKMIRSSILQYEAVKAMLPGSILKELEAAEKNVGGFLKELILEFFKEAMQENTSGSEQHKAAKVDIDFA